MTNTSDVLIVGSGAAGLTAALNLADRFRVTVLAKGALNEGSTAWAQGGIAAVLEPGDTFESHIEDTMIAGAGLTVGALSPAGHKLAIAVIAMSLLASPIFFLCARLAHRFATTGRILPPRAVAEPAMPGPG